MSHHLIHTRLGLSNLVLAATKPKGSSSGTSTLIFIVFIVLIGYFLLIRPQRQRARRQQAQVQQVGVGDRVMLTSGIIGRVIGFNGDRARVEIAHGVEIEVVRRAIGQRISDEDGVDEGLSEPSQPDPASDEADDYPHTSDQVPHPLDDGTGTEDAGDRDGSTSYDSADADGPGDDAWPPAAVHPDPDRTDVPGGGLADDGKGSGMTDTGKV